MTIDRTRFLTGLTGLAAAPFACRAAARGSDATRRAGSALVLGGGGARGAYEGGIVDGLRSAANADDGHPIAGVDVVCGTSIGSINAWFVATGRYAALRTLWHGVAAESVFETKHRYRAATKPGAFVIAKIVAALSLASGLTKNEKGILDGDRIAAWIERHVDLRVPLVIPLVFTVTNLDRERAEVFYRLPYAVSAAERSAAVERLRSTVGSDTVVREATDEIAHRALRASTAVPVLFDPVELPAPEGTIDRYVDGGIADNDPVDVARALCTGVYAVLVEPDRPAREAYASALAIGVGAFGVAQQRILEASLRSAYVESRGKRLATGTTGRERAFLGRILDADLFTIRPQSELAVATVEFDRQAKIDAAYAIGRADVARGWTPYEPSLPRG